MIKVYYNPDQILHNPVFELYDGLETEYTEKADRIEAILKGVKRFGIDPKELKAEISKKYLNMVHDERYVNFIHNKSRLTNDRKQIIPSYYIQDTYTPITRHTYTVASHSAGLALFSAGELIKNKNNIVYALCRPPGHHAERKSMGGYCYFNNASIAAQKLSESGSVAILDIDYHHGNGTQQYFYKRKDVLYVSIHADPEEAFPFLSGFDTETGEGEGEGFNINFPVSPSIGNKQYIRILRKVLQKIKHFDPSYLVISLGYDTYHDDPIGGMGLTEDVYELIAKEISEQGKPLLIVQEGGYSIESLDILAYNFLKGLESNNKND